MFCLINRMPFCWIEKLLFNLLCVSGLFSKPRQSALFQILPPPTPPTQPRMQVKRKAVDKLKVIVGISYGLCNLALVRNTYETQRNTDKNFVFNTLDLNYRFTVMLPLLFPSVIPSFSWFDNTGRRPKSCR